MHLLLLSVLLTAQASAASTVLDGWFEVKAPEDKALPFVVQGWAASACGHPEVTIHLDGAATWSGSTGITWQGVADRHPTFPGADRAGFWAQIDPAGLSAGEHTLEVMASAPGCGERQLGRQTFDSEPPLRPALAWPLLFAVLVVLPAGLAALLHRLPQRPIAIPGLLWWVAALQMLSITAIVLAPTLRAPILEIPSGLFAPLGNWDGGTYLFLAEHGYSLELPAGFAYFPIFPLVVRVLGWLPGPTPLLVALLNVTLLLAAVAILRRNGADPAGLLLLIASPFAFFFGAVYTESLFLLLAATFLFARSRHRLPLLALAGVLAGMTRVTGVALSLLALDALRERRFKEAAVAALSPLLGLTLWMAILWRFAGDPFLFLRAQTEFGRSIDFHPGRLWGVLWNAVQDGGVQGRFDLFLLIAVVCGAFGLARSGRWGEAAYSALVVLMPLYTLRLTSLSRYALLAFPVFLWLGSRLGSRRAVWILATISAVIMLVHATLFGQQRWVA